MISMAVSNIFQSRSPWDMIAFDEYFFQVVETKKYNRTTNEQTHLPMFVCWLPWIVLSCKTKVMDWIWIWSVNIYHVSIYIYNIYTYLYIYIYISFFIYYTLDDRMNRNSTWKTSRLFLLHKSVGSSVSATDLVVSNGGGFFSFQPMDSSMDGLLVEEWKGIKTMGYSVGKPPT